MDNNILEKVSVFLEGRNKTERIVSIECSYNDEAASVIYISDNGRKMIRKEKFFPFLWADTYVCQKMYDGDRNKVKESLRKYGITCMKTRTESDDGTVSPRMRNAFKILFKAEKPMSYSKFTNFFKNAGTPIYSDSKGGKKSKKEDFSKHFMAISPVEQHMIATGERLFKGYQNYDDLNRMLFDIETGGLIAKKHRINQIGVRTNHGFQKLISVDENGTEEQVDMNEISAIIEFFLCIKNIKPDIIAGYNQENFDFNFMIERVEILGKKYKISKNNEIVRKKMCEDDYDEYEDGSRELNFAYLSELVIGHPIKKKNRDQVLKLGGEVEYYRPTILWGHNIVDGLHAVRRTQAMDSNFKKADLKYATKYLKMNKPNRVYVPGDKIKATWSDVTNKYAFNDNDGSWFKITEDLFTKTYELPNTGNDNAPKYAFKFTKDEDNNLIINNETGEAYEIKSGQYIVERYLLDDIWETDKVELRTNESNFLISKMLPTTFTKACTMGTAGIWKLIMLAWSYENNLAIPSFAEKRRFTGGLSRLLRVGYVANIVKLDYNSLYPSIMLTWNIQSAVDVSHAITYMLEHVLTSRETYKDLKKSYGKKKDAKIKEIEEKVANGTISKSELDELKKESEQFASLEVANDKKQQPFKILGNSVFGSFGSYLFPWSDDLSAEKVTCIGRQSLRLLVGWFGKLGYNAIVGDSFMPDTPVFVRYYGTGMIDILPISDIFDGRDAKIDKFGREYDVSNKKYQVLCRSGWCDIEYVYRHKTNKDIWRVEDENGYAEVTEDHSIFNENQEKIKPSEINGDTKLEYYSKVVDFSVANIEIKDSLYKKFAKKVCDGKMDKIPPIILNSSNDVKKKFYDLLIENGYTNEGKTKSCIAGVNFLVASFSNEKKA